MAANNKTNRNALIVLVIGLCLCAWGYVSCRPVRIPETKVSNVLEVVGTKFYLTARGETTNAWGGDGPFSAEMWMNIETDGKTDQVMVYSNNQCHEAEIRAKIKSNYELRVSESPNVLHLYHEELHLGSWDIDARMYEGLLAVDPGS